MRGFAWRKPVRFWLVGLGRRFVRAALVSVAALARACVANVADLASGLRRPCLAGVPFGLGASVNMPCGGAGFGVALGFSARIGLAASPALGFLPVGRWLRGAAGQPNPALQRTCRVVRAVSFNFFWLRGVARLPWAARHLALR